MSLDSLVGQIASDLNDDAQGHEYTTWSEDQIRAWVEEGVNLVFDKRPDLFMERVVIKVEPCSIVQDTCDCEVVRRVIGQTTETGRLIKTLRTRGLEVSFVWTGKTCRRRPTPGSNTFLLESYAIDEVSDTLYLWPQVPPGVDVYVQVECAHRPTAEELERNEYKLPAGTDAAIKQWALWRGKSMDMEISPAAMTAAQQHYRAFFEVLGLSMNTTEVIHKREKS